MTKLKVEKSKREDIYKDIIRIPKRCRKTKGGKIIKEGELCLVSVPKTKKSVYAILRGCKKNQKSIFIDEYLRNKLGVEAGKEYKFVFKKIYFLDWICWAWNAADIGYRISLQIAFISLFLGIISIIISILF